MPATGRYLKLLFILAVSLIFISPALAQDAEPAATEEKEPTEELRLGTIANYGTYQKRVAVDSTSNAVPSEDLPNPISGSVRRVKSGQCEAVIINNSEDTSYSVGFRVIGRDKRGNSAFKRNFSASLKPGASVTRDVRCQKGQNMEVELVSGKALK